jgi:type II secretory pathway predicted ATPase ExeA/pSer/pThr/pTyr-binding forkhead associated (FHA) protein
MYLEPFKLNELPFRPSPDPQFLYLSKQHAKAKAYMQAAVEFGDGFVVVTGEIGSGKTTLIESFLKELPPDIVVAQVNQTQVNPISFLQTVLVQFGFSPFRMKKAELLATINHFLIEQYSAGRKVLLIVDEAQNLSLRVLEEIRLLSGVETTKEKVLRIILAGQPELNGKLAAPELVQLAQRIRLRAHLVTLSPAEVREYIEYRLEVAGADNRKIFVDEVFPDIYRYTGGVPRLINLLCDTSMMAAFAVHRNTVTPADVDTAVRELQWVDYVGRTANGGSPPAVTLSAPPSSTDPNAPLVGNVVVALDGRIVREVPVRVGRLIIGRTPDNDLQIDSRFISRHHCQIIASGNACVIEDLNSTNGIFVRTRRVRRHPLADGDTVLVGKHELTFHEHGNGELGNRTVTVPALRLVVQDPTPDKRDLPVSPLGSLGSSEDPLASLDEADEEADEPIAKLP